jgi:hypothetical protein
VRSPQEIRFRLRQEFGNLTMLLLPPQAVGRTPKPIFHPATAPLPDVVALADSLLAHRFPLLGLQIETGRTIDWRRDYLHGISTGTEYFRRVPYLDFQKSGDHKVVWELNRHQHLVLLVQAFLLTGRREYLDEAFAQLSSWLDANPFLRGINWASALEVAFRALSWTWLWSLAGKEMPPPLARRFTDELHRHGRFLELNLSVYFSPNTHLLGEAVALYAVGLMFDEGRWRASGARWTEDAMDRQVRADGSHFEQSAYYHVYALDFFLLYRVLTNPGAAYDSKLVRMAEYLDALLGDSGVLPLIGDDDGGRLFHPFGDRTQFGRATMATCAVMFDRWEWLRSPEDLNVQAAWWIGVQEARGGAPAARASRLFADAGTAVMVHRDIQVVIKAGPFGEGSGGHSHSDILSLVVRIGDREILIDPGTYTYIADPAERNAFRGSAAHNTVRVGGRDQAVPSGPFRWVDTPSVRIDRWESSAERDVLDAVCQYGGYTHRRRVVLVKADAVLIVVDHVEGGSGEASWHLGSDQDAQRFSFTAAAKRVDAWRSRALCTKERAVALVGEAFSPDHATVIDLGTHPVSVPVQWNGEEVVWQGRVYRL